MGSSVQQLEGRLRQEMARFSRCLANKDNNGNGNIDDDVDQDKGEEEREAALRSIDAISAALSKELEAMRASYALTEEKRRLQREEKRRRRCDSYWWC